MKKLTEEETDDRDKKSSEKEESIHHIKEIKKIEEKKHCTATVKKNGKKKELIIDTGSPITILALDEKILESTGIQKITNESQDLNKNGMKFCGKNPVDVEYEINKQRIDFLTTEWTDITPLLWMDWKKIQINIRWITIGQKQPIRTRENTYWILYIYYFENNETIKDTEIKIQLKLGHYPVKQKTRPVPLHLQKDIGRELEKLKKPDI